MPQAKKRLGQNFLRDRKILEKIVEAGEIQPGETVVEVGAGKGILTVELAKRARQVTALELDNDLIPYLRSQFAGYPNVEIRHEDVLRFMPPDGPYKVIANIPYYITSPIIRHFLHRTNKPSLLVLLMQKEVAEKIIQEKEESVLSLGIKLFGDPEIICTVPKEAFSPQPKVASAVLKIRVLKEPRIRTDVEKFLKLIKIAFAQPRKTLANNLANGLHQDRAEMEKILAKLNLNAKVRAGKLALAEWEQLLEILG